MVGVFLLLYLNLKLSSELNIDLIFSLQQNFHSDVILFPKQNGNEKTIKKLLNYQESQPNAFFGQVDFINYNKSTNSQGIISYKNKLVILDDEIDVLKKLIKIQQINPNILVSFIWIYLMKIPNETRNLDSLHIPYDSKFFIVKEINSSIFEIFDVYQISSSSPKIYSLYAVWESKKLRLLTKDIVMKRKNLQRFVIEVAGTEVADSLKKHFPFWDLLSYSMNFTLKRNWVKSVGLLFPNGTKIGVFKLLDENVVDAGSNIYSLTEDRLDTYDFIIPIVISQAKLYIGIKQGLNWKAYITPFEPDIWISIVAWVSLASFLMHVINRIISPVFNYSFQDPIFNFIRAFSNQGRNIEETRFIFYTCMLMPYILGIVLLQYYSADLLSHLTVKDSTPPFKNLRGVINDGSYDVALFYPSPLWQTLRAYFRLEKLIPINEKRLASGDFFHDLCIHRRVVIMGTYEFNIRVNCNVVELPEAIYSRTFGVMVRKGLPYKGIMTKLVRSFQAFGLSKLYQKNVVKEWESDYTIHPVELKTVFPAFILLLSFMCTAVAILFLEVMVWKLKKKKSEESITVITANSELS